jgi:hypothetical protein
MQTPHLCGYQWASLLHSSGYINDIGENWSVGDPGYCHTGVDSPQGWLNTREDVWTGIYGGTQNICAFGVGQQNPYQGAYYEARNDVVQGYDCGPNFYYGVNTSNMLTYGGWTTGQLTHDLQH